MMCSVLYVMCVCVAVNLQSVVIVEHSLYSLVLQHPPDIPPNEPVGKFLPHLRHMKHVRADTRMHSLPTERGHRRRLRSVKVAPGVPMGRASGCNERIARGSFKHRPAMGREAGVGLQPCEGAKPLSEFSSTDSDGVPPYPLDELRRTPGPPRPKDAPEGSPRGLRPIPARPRLKNRLEVGARQVTTHGHDGEGYLGSVAVEKATQGLERMRATGAAREVHRGGERPATESRRRGYGWGPPAAC